VTAHQQESPLLPKLTGLAAVVLILAGMRAAASVVNPLLLALLLAVICRPLVEWLQKRGLPSWAANTFILLVVPALITAVGLLVVSSARQLNDNLPTYQQRVEALSASSQQWLNDHGIQGARQQLMESLDLQKLAAWGASILGNFLGLLGLAGVILLFFVFLLLEASDFPAKLRRGLGAGSATLQRLRGFGESMIRYAFIKTWLGLAAAILDTVLLYALGVDFALLWGVLSFLMSFVPNLGYLISVVPPTLFALLEFGWGHAIGVLVGYQIINFGVDNIVGPRFLGGDLDLSPAVTIIAVFFWGWLLGPAGALLALPLTIAAKTLVLEPHEETRWLSVLISAQAEPSKK
jgi:predicted PurR-regulated permease PerM